MFGKVLNIPPVYIKCHCQDENSQPNFYKKNKSSTIYQVVINSGLTISGGSYHWWFFCSWITQKVYHWSDGNMYTKLSVKVQLLWILVFYDDWNSVNAVAFSVDVSCIPTNLFWPCSRSRGDKVSTPSPFTFFRQRTAIDLKHILRNLETFKKVKNIFKTTWHFADVIICQHCQSKIIAFTFFHNGKNV